jgi:N utilization substance protein A
VVDELAGERVDVLEWSDEADILVANALSPAKVSSVSTDVESRTATVMVPASQLSLAIGKDGQNARLAARLTGWRIDIKGLDAEEGEEPVAEPDAPGASGHDGTQPEPEAIQSSPAGE